MAHGIAPEQTKSYRMLHRTSSRPTEADGPLVRPPLEAVKRGGLDYNSKNEKRIFDELREIVKSNSSLVSLNLSDTSLSLGQVEVLSSLRPNEPQLRIVGR